MNDKLLKKLILETLQETLLSEEAGPDSSGEALKMITGYNLLQDQNVVKAIDALLTTIRNTQTIQNVSGMLQANDIAQALKRQLPGVINSRINYMYGQQLAQGQKPIFNQDTTYFTPQTPQTPKPAGQKPAATGQPSAASRVAGATGAGVAAAPFAAAAQYFGNQFRRK